MIGVIHGCRVVPILLIRNEGNARRLTLVWYCRQSLVERVDHFVRDGRAVQAKVLFRRNLEASGLDFEGLFDDNVRHYGD